jgi:integrase/recombinase XerD
MLDRTPFAIGFTVNKNEWDGARIGMRGKGTQARAINDKLTEYRTIAKTVLERLAEVQTRTQNDIHHAIQTTVKTAVTGKAPRGQKVANQAALNKLTLDNLVHLCYTQIRRGEKPLSQSRRNTYRTVAKKIHQYFNYNTPLINNISRMDMKEFKQWYYTKYKKHTGETRSTYLGIVTAIFNTAVENEMIAYSPIPKGFTPTVQNKDRKDRIILESSEVEKITTLLEPETANIDLIAKHCATLQIDTGMQYADIVTLTRKDYFHDNVNKEWIVKKPRVKSGEIFRVPLSRRAKESLDWLNETTGNDLSKLPNLRIINKAYKRLANRLNIKQFTSYDLRHTFAVHYMDNGGSIENLAVMMGHKKLETTRRYGQISDERLGKDRIKLEWVQLA